MKKLGWETAERMVCPPDSSDEAARKVASRKRVLDDMTEGCAFLLHNLFQKGKKVCDFFMRVPEFYVTETTEDCGDWTGGVLIRILREREPESRSSAEGVGVRGDRAACVIRPSEKGRKIRITAETESMEAAEEFCAKVAGKLREIKSDLTKEDGNDNI